MDDILARALFSQPPENLFGYLRRPALPPMPRAQDGPPMGAQFEPPSPASRMPDVGMWVDSLRFGAPEMGASASTPAFGGNVGVRGSIKPDPWGTSWSAKGTYDRQF